MSVIKLKNVCYCKRQNQGCLENISLNIEVGITVLRGDELSGTAFLLEIMGAMRKVDSGTVEIANTDITDFEENQLAVYRRRYIGTLLAENCFLPSINIYENIILPLELDDSEVDVEYIEQLADMVGIKTKLFDRYETLTESEAVRAAFVRALSAKPRVVVASNIEKYLSEKEMKTMLGVWRMTASKYQQSIVICSNDLQLKSLVDHGIEMQAGEIKETW